MGIQTYIDNRSKVQFANVLPFGKIVGQGTGSISVAASGIAQNTLAHSYTTTPSIFAWCRIQGNNNWIPMLTTDEFTADEFGSASKQVYIKPFTSATNFGVYVKNRDAGTGYTIDYKYWLYIV